MNQPETNKTNPQLPESNQSFLSLKVGKANKTGKCSQGYIHYRVLTDSSFLQLYITIVGNDGGGCYSKEIVPFDKVERCLQGIATGKSITSKLFQQAFISKSVNNAGFMAAILRAENLLLPVPDAVHQHAVQPDWAAWKTAMLALASQAEQYQPELPKQRSKQRTTNQDSTHETHQPHSQCNQPQPTGAEPPTEAGSVTHESADGDHAELDDAEMGYLLGDSQGIDIIQQQSEDEVETAVGLNKSSKKQRNEKRPHPTAQERRP